MLPRLTGVLTGRFRSKTSGESMGPKVTLFLDRLTEGSPVLWVLPNTVDSGRFLAGEGVLYSSLDSGIDWSERSEEFRLLLRCPVRSGGMGVATFTTGVFPYVHREKGRGTKSKRRLRKTNKKIVYTTIHTSKKESPKYQFLSE